MPDENIFNNENQQNEIKEENISENNNVNFVFGEGSVFASDSAANNDVNPDADKDVQNMPPIQPPFTQSSERQTNYQYGQFYQGQQNSYQQNNNQGTYYSYTPNPGSFGGQFNSQPYNSDFYNNKPPKKKRTGLKITISIVAIVAVVSTISLVGYWALNEIGNIFKNNHNNILNSSKIESDDDNGDLDNLVVNSKPHGANEFVPNSDGTLTAAAVISKVRPSTVGIVQYVNSNNGIPTINGQGSGIIISDDGYIVTNAHVVENSSMITVVLENDEEYRATLKGLDTQTDLAVLKIEKVGLTPAELGDSSQTVVGESVIAIGNPGGLELAGSCTGGMVSGLNRSITSDTNGYAMTYIQTDAAINPGNSGGALVNMYGQVIGINSAKVASTGYEGLGFAIPINEALPIIKDLQQYGYVKNRAKIGISFQLISEMVSQYYNYSVPAGLLITEIDEKCDIARKDVEINDIITKIDGKNITSASVVYSVLQAKKPGDIVRLTVYRMGTRASTSKTFEVDIILSESTGE